MRMLDYGIEHALYFAETSKRGKRRRAFLDEEFASRAGLHFLQPAEKVFARDLQGSECGRSRAIGFKRGVREEAAQSNHADFLSQSFEISPHKAVGMLGDLPQIDVGRERHGACVNPENLQARLSIRNADFDFAVESPGTPQ